MNKIVVYSIFLLFQINGVSLAHDISYEKFYLDDCLSNVIKIIKNNYGAFKIKNRKDKYLGSWLIKLEKENKTITLSFDIKNSVLYGILVQQRNISENEFSNLLSHYLKKYGPPIRDKTYDIKKDLYFPNYKWNFDNKYSISIVFIENSIEIIILNSEIQNNILDN